MKAILLMVVCVAVAQASVDWSKVRPRDAVPTIFPRMRLAKYVNKIVGGSEAVPNSYPYQVALILTAADGNYFCGGSLINENFVLTAAHCTDGVTEASVILGAHNVRDTTEPTQVRMVSTTINVHSGWDSSTLTNDIAVIRLPEAAPLGAAIAIQELIGASDGSVDNIAATVSGWGKDSDGSDTISDVLRYRNVNIITNSECNSWYFGSIQATHVCSSESTCSGDSGGPLVANIGGQTKQVGVVSFGISFGCEIGFPVVFTRVSSYLSWIEGAIQA